MFRINSPFGAEGALLGYVNAIPASSVEVSTVPKKLLIVRLSAIGDVVHVLHSLKTLRESYPSSHIAWLVEDKAEGILRGQADLDEIIVFPKKKWLAGLKNPLTFIQTTREIYSFISALRSKGFELALDFQGNLKSGIMTFLTGTPLRVGFTKGYCREGNFLFTNYHIAPALKRLHRIEKNLALLEGLGLRPARAGVSLFTSREDEEFVDSFLKNIKGPVKGEAVVKPLVVIHPGTSDFGAYKRWPIENYAQLADKLVGELGLNVVFTWGPSELERVKEIITTMKQTAYPGPKTETLGQLVSLIRRANLFISGDTGPMHIASALGISQVAIFGPKDPVIYGPYQKNAIVVRKEFDCSPCTKRTCDDPICITSITPEDVFGAAKVRLVKNFVKNS